MPRTGALLGGLIVLGWVLHDLAVGWANLQPHALVGALLPSLVAVGIGALAGALLGAHRLAAPAALALLLAASVAPKFVQLPFAQTQLWLPRCAFLCVVAWLVIARLPRERAWVPRAPLGLLAGYLACALVALFRLAPVGKGWPSPVGPLATALAVLLLGWIRPARARTALQLLALVLGLAHLGGQGSSLRKLRRADQPAPVVTSALDGPNVVFIVLDTVRADRLASYGYERATTPHLDRFAAEHMTRFTQARATGPWTLPSHGSLFTGLYPAEHGATTPRRGLATDTVVLPAWPGQPLRPEVPTLAERLAAVGFQTAGIVANSFYVRHEFGMGRGFQHWDDRHRGALGDYFLLFQTTGAAPWLGHRGYRDGGDITAEALRWLDAERDGGPFLLFLNYFDAHYPYLPPAPFDRAFDAPRVRDPLRAGMGAYSDLYDRELLALDDHLGRLLDGLVARGLLEDTLLVVTSDHGEAFGEHGIWKHSWGLYDELLHVPLFIKPAAGRTALVDDTPISGAELHDAILRAVGLEPPARSAPAAVKAEFFWGNGLRMQDVESLEKLFGVDLRRDLASWIEGDRKLVVASTGKVEAFDLAADPDETAPLELSAEEVEAARARAATWWAERPAPEPTQLDLDLDADSLRALRDVGYAGD